MHIETKEDRNERSRFFNRRISQEHKASRQSDERICFPLNPETFSLNEIVSLHHVII